MIVTMGCGARGHRTTHKFRLRMLMFVRKTQAVLPALGTTVIDPRLSRNGSLVFVRHIRLPGQIVRVLGVGNIEIVGGWRDTLFGGAGRIHRIRIIDSVSTWAQLRKPGLGESLEENSVLFLDGRSEGTSANCVLYGVRG